MFNIYMLNADPELVLGGKRTRPLQREDSDTHIHGDSDDTDMEGTFSSGEFKNANEPANGAKKRMRVSSSMETDSGVAEMGGNGSTTLSLTLPNASSTPVDAPSSKTMLARARSEDFKGMAPTPSSPNSPTLSKDNVDSASARFVEKGVNTFKTPVNYKNASIPRRSLEPPKLPPKKRVVKVVRDGKIPPGPFNTNVEMNDEDDVFLLESSQRF